MERKQSALKVLVHNQWDPATFVLEESLQKLYLDSITYCRTCYSDKNIVTCLHIFKGQNSLFGRAFNRHFTDIGPSLASKGDTPRVSLQILLKLETAAALIWD